MGKLRLGHAILSEMARTTDQIPREEKGKMIVEDSEDSWDEGYESTEFDTSFYHGGSETIDYRIVDPTNFQILFTFYMVACKGAM